MSNHLINLLNCNDHLNDNIHLFINAFVDYYGEDKREEIEDKFSKALFIAYRDPSSTMSYVNQASKLKTIELEKRLLKQVDADMSQYNLFDSNNFKFINIMPISRFKEFYQLHELGAVGRLNRFAAESYKKITDSIPNFPKEDIDEMTRTGKVPSKYSNQPSWIKNNLLYLTDLSNAEKEYKQKFKKTEDLLKAINPKINFENFGFYIDTPEVQALISIASELPSVMEEYNEYMKRFEKYEQEAEVNSELKEIISHKHFVKFIMDNIDLIPEECREGLEEFYKDPMKSYLVDDYVRYIFGYYSVSSPSPLEAFSSKANEKLKGDEPDWVKNKIIENRKEFFAKKGIVINSEEDFNKEDVKKYWPDVNRIDRFLKSKEEAINNYNIEYYNSLPSHKKIREQIDKRNLLDKEDSMQANLYTTNQKTFLNPNIRETSEGYELYSILAVDCSTDTGFIDHHVVHELNHLYELFLLEADGQKYECISGWDIMTARMNQEVILPASTVEENEDKRKYELFSEIINEIISQDIGTILHEKYGYVFDTKENAKMKHTTSYEYTFFLVRDFYDEFRDKILESRKGGNIEVIWKAVGKENFDELNDLFRIFNDNFSGMQIYGVLSDLKAGMTNERTEIYKELVSRSQEIIHKMKAYNSDQDNMDSIKVL